jgi:hypothetical protein
MAAVLAEMPVTVPLPRPRPKVKAKPHTVTRAAPPPT